MTTLDVMMVHRDLDAVKNIAGEIPWDELNMRPLSCVPTGDLALKYLAKNRVDILLADIGASVGNMNLIEYLANSYQDFLIIVIASPPRMDQILLAMRHQFVYDYIEVPLNSREITHILKSAGKFWHDWSFSLSLRKFGEESITALTPQLEQDANDTIRAILNATTNADTPAMVSNVEKLFKEIVTPPNHQNMPLARAVTIDLLAQLRYLLSSRGVDNTKEFAVYSFIHKVWKASNSADLEALCLSYLHRCICLLSLEPETQLSALVRTALQITRKNYSDSSFTLVTLAEEIGVSPNYLSSIFKMETGVRFKRYLNTFRVAKAKELLLDGRYKIFEVADLVGIEDSRYFSQIFKTYTGMKPSDYRNNKQLGKKEETS